MNELPPFLTTVLAFCNGSSGRFVCIGQLQRNVARLERNIEQLEQSIIQALDPTGFDRSDRTTADDEVFIVEDGNLSPFAADHDDTLNAANQTDEVVVVSSEEIGRLKGQQEVEC